MVIRKEWNKILICAVCRRFWFVFDCDMSFDTFCFEGLTTFIAFDHITVFVAIWWILLICSLFGFLSFVIFMVWISTRYLLSLLRVLDLYICFCIHPVSFVKLLAGSYFGICRCSFFWLRIGIHGYYVVIFGYLVILLFDDGGL